MNSHDKSLLFLIREIRTCFNQMKTLAENLHHNLGINASERAVLETLMQSSPQTVPEIAKGKGVSRQHIQNIMNGLVDSGLSIEVDNPKHRKSSLFLITEKGRTMFSAMQNREEAPIKRIAASLSSDELLAAQLTLHQLNNKLSTEIEILRGSNHE
jgi:DNA-binding MarR family transcriptional regulator